MPFDHLLRVGVVGCGYWGSKHVRVLRQLPEVAEVVVIDPRPEVLKADPAVALGVNGFDSLDAALPFVDAVVIATPPTTHLPLALRAIRAGKHVLVEKPLATSAADARQLIAAAEAHGVLLMVGHTFEYNAAVWKLRELVQGQELGTVHYVDTARLNLGLYQHDVNVVMDLAPHDISIINALLGCGPSRVHAWGSRHAHSRFEDVAYIRLDYAEVDVTANVHVSWLDPCKVRRVTAVGDRKMAVYNDMSSEERIRVHDKSVVSHGAERALSYRFGDITSPFLAFEEPLLVQDRHLVSCAITGAQPRTDGLNGLAVVEVLEAAQISLAEHRAVQIDELRQPVGSSAVSRPIPAPRPTASRPTASLEPTGA
jgi:predicted dehydrogenase